MIDHFLSRQFFVFLLTGGFAALVNFLSRILYNEWMSFSSAVLLAYITGMVTAFILARVFVFRDSGLQLHISILFFSLVNLAAVVQTWLVSMGLAYYVLPAMNVTHYSLEFAHFVGIAIPVFTSYLGHKYWSFKS